MDLIVNGFLHLERPAYYCPDSKYYLKTCTPDLPKWSLDYDMNKDDPSFTLSFEGIFPDVSGYSLAASKEYLSSTSKTWVHDFTYEVLATSLDMRLSSYFPRVDHEDHLTPDFIQDLGEGHILVVEFATCASNHRESLVKSFMIKKYAYEEALLKRMIDPVKKVTFLIIVTSSKGVMTNCLDLPQMLVNELCLRYILAQNIELALEESTLFPPKRKVEESSYVYELRSIFNSIKVEDVNFEGFEPFSLEMYNSFVKPYNKKKFSEEMVAIVKEAHSRAENYTDGKVPRGKFATRDYGKEILHINNKTGKLEGLIIDELSRILEDDIKSYEEECRQGERRLNSDKKSVLLFPGVVLKTSPNNTLKLLDSFPDEMIDSDDIRGIWSKVGSELRGQYFEDVEAEIEEIIENSLKSDDKRPKTAKLKYKRINLQITDAQLVELAKRGVQGKNMVKKRNEDVLKHREAKSLLFSLDVEVDDIEEAIQDPSWFFKHYDDKTLGWSSSIEALRESASIHTEHGADFFSTIVSKLMSTNLSSICSLVSDIATELSASLKQHCKTNQFILKKLKDRDLYLLIKPTKMSELVFVSMAWDITTQVDQLKSTIFQGVYQFGNLCCTDFISLDSSKLVNWVKAESFLLSIQAYWAEFYSIRVWEESFNFQSCSVNMMEFKKMVLYSFFMALHDKRAAEEPITLSRFVNMEGFVSFPSTPDPGKMISKLSRYPKSRLEVWNIKRILDNMRHISSGGYFYENNIKETNEDNTITFRRSWKNLYNFITKGHLERPDQLISLFYLGYLTNKDQKTHSNITGQLYTKILEWEENKPNTYDHLGLKDPSLESIKKHEFSPTIIKGCLDHCDKILKNKYGDTWRLRVEEDLLTDIVHLDIEEYSTLKASSNFSNKWYNFFSMTKFNNFYKTGILPDEIENSRPAKDFARQLIEVKGNVERKRRVMSFLESCDMSTTAHYQRNKVIQNLNDIRGGKVKMYQLIKESLEHVERNGCLNIDLFRKVQYGLREIYVLGINERVLQLIIERMSRTICSYFEAETMTHPKSKLDIPNNHTKAASQTYSKKFATFTTSDDAEKWNQGHFVTKFALLLIHFTPKYMHGFIMSVLKFWMKKRIMIDPTLLEFLNKPTFTSFYDTYLQKLHDAVKGEIEVDWFEQGTTFIQTQTGMMQGILHYTSSLYHTVMLEYYSSLVTTLSKSQSFQLSDKVIVSNMQSSDDSAVLISGSTEGENQLNHLAKFCRFSFKLKDVLSLMLGIYRSKKSTSNCLNLVEFNSEFIVGGNLYRATLRWISAAMSISEQECLASRQEEMASLLTNILEGGGSFFTCSVSQWAQGLLHYRMLGSSVHRAFMVFIRKISYCKDPALGYFLMDNPFGAGLTGFTYNVWVFCQNTNLGLKYKFFLDNLKEHKRDDKKAYTVENTKAGTFINSTMIKWGDRQKHRRLIASLNFPQDWEDKCNIDPEILYRRAKNSEELTLKLAIKVHSPGVAESLGKGNPIPRIIASSVYVIDQNVLSAGKTWSNDEADFTKYSLMKAALEDFEITEGCSKLDGKDLKTLFPFHHEFISVEQILSKYTKPFIADHPVREFKNRSRIEVVDPSYEFLTKPENIIKWKWFGIDHIGAASRVKETLWERLKEVFIWLEENPHDTLANPKCPFTSHIQIQNFFSRIDKKGRTVHLTGSPLGSKNGKTNMETAIKLDFFPCCNLSTNEMREKAKIYAEVETLMHILRSISTAPLSDEYKTDLMERCLTRAPELPVSSLGRTRRNCLALIKHASTTATKGIISHRRKEEILQMIEKQNLGTIGSFTVKQKWAQKMQSYIGVGVWKGRIDGTRVYLQMEYFHTLKKTVLTSIVVGSMKNFSNVMNLIKILCREMSVSNDRVVSSKSKMIEKVDTTPIYYMEDFKLKVNARTSCPIYLKPSLMVRNIEELAEKTLSIQHIGNTIRIIISYHNYRKSVNLTILSYTTKDSDLIDPFDPARMEPYSDILGKDPTNSWILNKPMPFHKLKAFLDQDLEQSKQFHGVLSSSNVLKDVLHGLISRNENVFNSMDLDTQAVEVAEREECSDIDVDYLTTGRTVEMEENFENSGFLDFFAGPSVSNWASQVEEAIGKAEEWSKTDPFTTIANETNDNMFLGLDLDMNVVTESNLFARVNPQRIFRTYATRHRLLDDLYREMLKESSKESVLELLKKRKYKASLIDFVPLIAKLRKDDIDDYVEVKRKVSKIENIEFG